MGGHGNDKACNCRNVSAALKAGMDLESPISLACSEKMGSNGCRAFSRLFAMRFDTDDAAREPVIHRVETIAQHDLVSTPRHAVSDRAMAMARTSLTSCRVSREV
jgi:hypothetical protein